MRLLLLGFAPVNLIFGLAWYWKEDLPRATFWVLVSLYFLLVSRDS